MEDQRRVIEDLARLKDEYVARLEPIASAIEASAIQARPMERALPGTYIPTQAVNVSGQPVQSPELDFEFEQLSHYSHLINTLLEEVDIVQNRIDAELRTRLWNDIVHTHRRETTAMKRIYGYEHLQKAMRGKAWDLVRTDLEANDPATIPAAASYAYKCETPFLAHGPTADSVSDPPVPERPDPHAFIYPVGYPCRATSPSPVSPHHLLPLADRDAVMSPPADEHASMSPLADEDIAMSPPSDAAMSRGPEAYERAYDFEVQESDKWLPLAKVARIMKAALPNDAEISREAKETMQECVSELISFVTSEAAENRNLSARRVIGGEDVLLAFDALGFEHYAEALTIYLARYRGVARDEVVASLNEPLGFRKHDGSSRSETQDELAGIPAQATAATGAVRDSEDAAHVTESEAVGERRSVVDELLAQWTIL